MRKTKAVRRRVLPKATPAETSLVYHRINALLHTMRCIAQHEDQLCTLLHAVKREAASVAEFEEELADLLDDLPSQEYTDDLKALREVVPARAARPAKRVKAIKTTKAASSRQAS